MLTLKDEEKSSLLAEQTSTQQNNRKQSIRSVVLYQGTNTSIRQKTTKIESGGDQASLSTLPRALRWLWKFQIELKQSIKRLAMKIRKCVLTGRAAENVKNKQKTKNYENV